MISRASTIVIGLLALGASTASAALPQGNLLQNPGAETFEDWVAGAGLATAVEYGAPGEFPSTVEGALIGGGHRFFAGGEPDTSHGDPSTAVLTQAYDIPASAAQDIDSGDALVTIGGCLGGSLSQHDSTWLGLEFRTAPDGDTIGPSGVSVEGPTAAERGNLTRFLPRVLGLPVPAGTRYIVVRLEFHRASGRGTYNDGYADNLDLRLTPADSPPPLPTCVAPTPGGGSGGGTGGGGVGGTGGGAPPSPFPVRQRSKTAHVSRSAISLRLTCDAHDAPCAGRISLKARGLRRAAPVKLGAAKFSVAPAATKTLRVRLGRHAKRRLAALSEQQLRRLRLTAKVTVGHRSATFRLRLKR